MEGQHNEESHPLYGASITRTKVSTEDRGVLRKDSSELANSAP